MPVPQYILDMRRKIGSNWLVVAAVSAIVRDEQGRFLLQKRGDTGERGLSGGILEPGERFAPAIVREVREETGLDVIPKRMVGVFSFRKVYPNGDKATCNSVTFECEVVGGRLQTDGDETLDLDYFHANALPANLVPFHHLRIAQALKNEPPYFEPALNNPESREYYHAIRPLIGNALLMVLAAEAIVQDADGHILLHRQPDSTWTLPGGISHLFERPAQTVVRTLYNKTGLQVHPERITGVYAGEDNIVTDTNGDVTAYNSVTFACQVRGGQLHKTDALSYFPIDDLPLTQPIKRELPMH